MAYVDSSGKTHVSLSEAASGYAAKHTASRNASGQIVGNSTGSRYAREQEAKRDAASERANKIDAARKQTTGFFSRDNAGNVAIAQTGERARQTQSIANQVKKFGNTKVNKQSLASYAKNLYGAGKSIATGRELTNKQKEAVERFSTTKEFRYSNIAKEIDRSGKDISTWLKKKTHAVEATKATENIPIVGSVVKGLYDVTDIGNMAGQVAYGAERYIQTPRIILPSVPVGAGMVVQSVENDPVRFVSSLVAMEGLGRVAKAGVRSSPVKVKSVKLQEVTPGEAAAVKDIKLGYSLNVKEKPLISYSKETGKLKRGAVGASKEAIEGKQIQAFTKSNTKAFEETLKQIDPTEQTYFKSGKTIAETAYKQRKAITKPNSLDILSEHVPQSMRGVVKDTITGYSGLLKTRDIQVYGSVPQKLQMSGFFTRSPKDIELSVSSVNKFVSNFRKNANKSGYKEGIDYRITGDANAPKIEFKMDGAWEKGVEVFSKNKQSKASVENDVGVGYRSESGIAYGFKGKKSIKADKVKMMKLQEQAARKFAGGTTLKDGKIELMHGGRVKDVRDLIEIGAAYEVTKGLGIAKEIVTYAKIGAQKNPAILESPIVKYIVENGKLPGKAEILKMTESVESAKMNTAIRGAETVKDLELIFSSDSVNISKAISKGVVDRSKTVYIPASKDVIISDVSKMASSKAVEGSSKGTFSKSTYSKIASKFIEASVSLEIASKQTLSKSTSKTKSSKTTRSKTTPSKTGSRGTRSKGTGSKSTTSKDITSKSTSSKQTKRVRPPRSTASKTSTSEGDKPIIRPDERNPVIKTSKKRKDEEVLENERDLYRMKRTIHNVLGNMDSFFGGSTTTKRKTATKKRTTKRKSKTK